MLDRHLSGVRRAVPALLLGVIAVTGCDDDPLDPNDPSNFGSVHVAVTTTGYAPDFAEAYQVGLEGGGPVEVAVVDGEATLVGAAAGQQTVVLDGVPEYCTVPNNPATVTVSAGATAEVAFNVTCDAVTGGVNPVFTLTGAAEDIDPEVGLIVINETTADTAEAVPLDPSAPEQLLHLDPGPHTIVLDTTAVAANCTWAAPVQAVEITVGQEVDANFGLDCAPNLGTLTVDITTNGTDFAPETYTLTVGELEPVNAPNTGSNEFADLRVGQYPVELDPVAENCSVVPTARQTASVTFGEETVIEFTVNCTAPAEAPTVRSR
jgi:hypothetical protein